MADVPDTVLTPKQIRFVELYFDTHNATEAYIQAYNWTGSRAWASVEASRLLKNPKITPMVEQIRTAKLDEVNYRLGDHITKLSILQGEAMKGNKPNIVAALKAEELIAKAMGFQKSTLTIERKPSMEEWLEQNDD